MPHVIVCEKSQLPTCSLVDFSHVFKPKKRCKLYVPTKNVRVIFRFFVCAFLRLFYFVYFERSQAGEAKYKIRKNKITLTTVLKSLSMSTFAKSYF